MEHVVEKCREALSQYMQPWSCIPVVNVSTSNKSIQTVKSEDCPSMPVIVSVRGSDVSGQFEGENGPESDVFQVQISDEHQDPEKTSGAEEEDREAVVMLDDHGQLDAGVEEPNMEGRAKGNGIRGAGRVWRQWHGEQRGGRGIGFKHRKRYTFKDRKLMGNYQDYQEHLPKPDETMGLERDKEKGLALMEVLHTLVWKLPAGNREQESGHIQMNMELLMSQWQWWECAQWGAAICVCVLPRQLCPQVCSAPSPDRATWKDHAPKPHGDAAKQ